MFGLVDVVLLGLARGDEVAVLKLHGLGALRAQLALGGITCLPLLV